MLVCEVLHGACPVTVQLDLTYFVWVRQGWRILDFLSHYPESCHILTWLLDEPGIPADWVHLEGTRALPSATIGCSSGDAMFNGPRLECIAAVQGTASTRSSSSTRAARTRL